MSLITAERKETIEKYVFWTIYLALSPIWIPIFIVAYIIYQLGFVLLFILKLLVHFLPYIFLFAIIYGSLLLI